MIISNSHKIYFGPSEFLPKKSSFKYVLFHDDRGAAHFRYSMLKKGNSLNKVLNIFDDKHLANVARMLHQHRFDLFPKCHIIIDLYWNSDINRFDAIFDTFHIFESPFRQATERKVRWS